MTKALNLPIRIVVCLAAIIALPLTGKAQSYTTVQLADGFDYPVGKPDGWNYYVYRGFTQHGHLGEDWNGKGGGNTDLGDAIYSTAHGVVVFSEDYKRGWGNVVIIRHAYRGYNGLIQFVDSLYGHCKVRLVRVGDRVTRGQKIGTIGRGPNNMYTAHLHYEIRKDLRVGMRRTLYPKTYGTYHDPRKFMNSHRKLRFESRMVRVPIHTFQKSSVPNRVYAKDVDVEKVDTGKEARPAVPKTTSSVILKETNTKAPTKPEASQNVLDKLFKTQ